MSKHETAASEALRRRIDALTDELMGMSNTSTGAAPSEPLTLDKVREAASLINRAIDTAPARYLATGHVKSEGRAMVIDHDKMIFPFPYDAIIGLWDLVKLARLMRAEGRRPVRTWKGHQTAIFEFR